MKLGLVLAKLEKNCAFRALVPTRIVEPSRSPEFELHSQLRAVRGSAEAKAKF